MISEIMIPKKSKNSKRQTTLFNEYSGNDVPLIVSMDKKMYNSEGYVCEGSGKNYKFFYAQDDNMAKADIDNDKDADTIKTTYFSKSLKDNKEDTLLSNTLVKKLMKHKRKHEMEANRVEIAPLKNDGMGRKRPITECNEYSENEIAELPLYTPEMGVYQHINDYDPVVVEKFFELFSVRYEHQTKDQTVGSDERTPYMISDTNIKSFNVRAPESTRTGKSSIECDICSKTFISKYKLSIHYRTHTGEKPYECDICRRCFSQRSILVAHYRMHTGEKPYECDICTVSFSVKSELVSHSRTHTGEKPYKCDICSRCFSIRSNLVSHCRTHTGEKPYECDVFRISFS